MSKRKTIEEHNQEIERLKERLRKAEAERAKTTKAEEARTNADIIRALREWVQVTGRSWEELPGYFRREASDSKQDYSWTDYDKGD